MFVGTNMYGNNGVSIYVMLEEEEEEEEENEEIM